MIIGERVSSFGAPTPLSESRRKERRKRLVSLNSELTVVAQCPKNEVYKP